MSLFIRISYFFSLFLWANVSFSAEKVASKMLTSTPVTTGALLQTLLGLILVISIIAFLAWLLRRTGRFQMSANGELKIIASLALGPRERAVLLQVGKQQLLVGITTQQIRTLHILDENVSTEPKRSEKISSSFAEKLQHIMQQRGEQS